MALGRSEMSNDQLVWILVSLGALGLAWSKRRLLLGALGRWLQQHQVTLPPGQGLVTVPFLGGLDLARILAGAATAGLLALAAAYLARPWLARNRQARELRRRTRNQASETSDDFN